VTATRLPGLFIVRTLREPGFGTVSPAARADLLLTEVNPLDSLDTLRRPRGVMVHGRWYDAAALDTMREAVKADYAIGAGR
jgi:hypothetical protein